MLKLDSDRLDYGELLRAPPGYQLHAAITTTFALDLETLAAASLALTLDQTLEDEEAGELSGERIALLEAIDQLQKRLLVFYQRGNIKVPSTFNRLFTLLEPLLVPAVALEGTSGAFASFHPKMWLLRFSTDKPDGSECWRLIVLSRNLTFDRSWDLAVAIDGEMGTRRGNGDPRLTTFLRSLTNDAAYGTLIDEWCEALALVSWQAPAQFDTAFEVLPGRHGDDAVPTARPLALDGKLDDVLVVSPFVDAGEYSMLCELGRRTREGGRRTLISRSDTLDRIGAHALKDWTVLSLPDRIVDGEEHNEEKAPARQNLHAKLIVAKQGGQAIWHVGSANMTDAAFGQPARDVLPRNLELMVRLTGRNHQVGPAKLLEQWTAAKVFRPHAFRDAGPLPLEVDPEMRRVVHALTSADWRFHVRETVPDQYAVRLDVQPGELAERLPKGYAVTVRLLCRDDPRPLVPSVLWEQVSLTDISSFLPVEVRSPQGLYNRFAVQAAFSVDLLDRRKRAIFRDVVGNGEKLLRYLALVLDLDPSRSDWSRAEKSGRAIDVFGLSGKGALYEQLLRAASRAPRRMIRAIEIFDRIRAEVPKLPEGLEVLFDSFDQYRRSRIT